MYFELNDDSTYLKLEKIFTINIYQYFECTNLKEENKSFISLNLIFISNNYGIEKLY